MRATPPWLCVGITLLTHALRAAGVAPDVEVHVTASRCEIYFVPTCSRGEWRAAQQRCARIGLKTVYFVSR